MTQSDVQCRICGTQAKCGGVPMSNIERVDCTRCGEYYYCHADIAMDPDGLFGKSADRGKVSALLFERKMLNRRALPPALVSDIEAARGGFLNALGSPYAVPIRVDELLATWPTSVPDQLDRAISLLSRLHPRPSEQFKPEDNGDVLPARWLLAEDENQAGYVQDHLLKNQWIEQAAPPASNRNRRITPKGWERVAELTRQNARTNPVFVAMWFGGRDRVTEMTNRYENAIRPAIRAAGYNEHRSDRDEHNEGIMDKIRFDIRRAPFVVADFTDHNRGVYYEAGLAAGHGVEVIHCCPKDEFKEKHFDIAHRNLIKYEDDADLRLQLRRRILGSPIGEGPFFKERGSEGG